MQRWSMIAEKYQKVSSLLQRHLIAKNCCAMCLPREKKHEMHVENFGHCVFHTMSACLPNWIFPQLLFFPLHPLFPPLLHQNFQEKWVRPFFCVIVFSIADKFPLFDFGFSSFEDSLARDFPQFALTHLVTWCWLPPLLNGLKIGWKARKQFWLTFLDL